MSAYLTITEANQYFDKRLDTNPWDDASSKNKQKALEQATQIIDRLNYNGSKTDDEQENEFPRGGDTEIPDDVKYATAEIALALLDGVDPEIEFENLNMTVHRYGPVQNNYDHRSPPIHTLAGVPSVTAWRYLIPYLRDNREIEMHRI